MLGNMPVESGVLGASPLDVSFDIDGYYGAGRSPVEAITRYPSQPQTDRQADDLLRPPSPRRKQPVSHDRELKSRPSLETLQSTFTESSTDLPSPALYNFPNLVAKRVESGSTSPLSDIFGSDVDGDDGKQELFDELQAMQERLLEAAREVRRGLNAGTPAGDRKRKDATPGLVGISISVMTASELTSTSFLSAHAPFHSSAKARTIDISRLGRERFSACSGNDATSALRVFLPATAKSDA